MDEWSLAEWRRQAQAEARGLRHEARAAGPRVDPGPRPLRCYRFTLTCPHCGGDVVHEAGGTPGIDTRAIARCASCKRPWQIRVVLLAESGNIHGPSVFAKDHQLGEGVGRRRETAGAA